MASVPQLLTPEEFHRLYDGVKPYVEYCEGRGVQKSVPTFLHMLVQGLIRDLLREAGLQAGTELELRIVEDWHPIPDVVGAKRFPQQPYPTEPFEVVAEILSPDDRMSDVQEKCRRYATIGIQMILVLDPEHRFGLIWEQASRQLVITDAIDLPNGKTILLSVLWKRLEDELA